MAQDRYRLQEDGALLTLWDESEGVGLQFRRGDTLQAYTAAIVISNTEILSTEDGVARLSKIQEQLTAKARELYPEEFREIQG